MYERLTTIFVSIAMVAAVETFIASHHTFLDWALLVYFLINSIRYYYGDFRFQECFSAINPKVELTVKAIDFHLYVIARLLIIAAALKLDDAITFCLISIAYQLLSIGHLSFSLSAVCVDKANPQMDRLRLLQSHWIYYSAAEALFLTAMAVLLRVVAKLAVVLAVDVGTVESVGVAIVFTGLGLVILIDWIQNRDLLFEG